MLEQIDLNAGWGNREESLEECAIRAFKLLQILTRLDVLFAQWFQMAESRNEALKGEIDLNLESCRQLLARGRNRRSVGDRAVFEDMGYHMSLWNGLERESGVTFRLHAGAYAGLPVRTNSCVIEFPRSGPVCDRLLKKDTSMSIMNAVVQTCDPDWARISTYEVDKTILGNQYSKIPWVGWMTYLSDRCGKIPPLPDEFEVTRVNQLGSLVVIRNVDRVTVENPIYVEIARRLFEILREAGFFQGNDGPKWSMK